MLNIGPLELLVVLLVALIVVGPQKLPELGRTIGKSLREFRRAQDELRDTLKFDFDDAPAVPAKPLPSEEPDRELAPEPRSAEADADDRIEPQEIPQVRSETSGNGQASGHADGEPGPASPSADPPSETGPGTE